MGYENIPKGVRGTEVTIGRMRQLALQGSRHLEVVELARKIVSGVRAKDYRGEIDALYWWVKENTRYVQDPRTTEWLQHPHYTLLVSGADDCDGMAVAMAALGLAIGHPALFRAVKADPSRPGEFSHVYAMLGVQEGQGVSWVPVDTTMVEAFPGWEPDGARLYGVRDWPIA